MRILIGLVGEKGGGKGTFAKVLAEHVQGMHVERVGFGDFLKRGLAIWNLPDTRENLQKLSIAMNGVFGPDTLANAVRPSLAEHPADILVLDGVRWEADVRLVRSFPENFLVYITADPNVRYERTRLRKEKEGEGSATFEEFMAQEQVQTETLIPAIGKQADFSIINHAGLEEFGRQVQHFIDLHLAR
jgi:dephospho-CoA kinase